MGVDHAITAEKFPKQGSHVNQRADVCFHYDTSRKVQGTVVRDDAEAPWMTIIRLDDGRHVLASECQYSPVSHLPAGAIEDPTEAGETHRIGWAAGAASARGDWPQCETSTRIRMATRLYRCHRPRGHDGPHEDPGGRWADA